MPSLHTTISCRFFAQLITFAASIAALASGAVAQTSAPSGRTIPVQILPSAMRWSVPISAPSTLPPAIGEGKVVVVLPPDHVAAFNLADGNEVWRVDLRPDQPISIADGVAYVAAGEAVHAIRLQDGVVVWRRPAGALSVPILVREGWVIASSADRLMALRATDGTVVWEQPSAEQKARATIDGNVLYVPYADRRIVAFDLQTGKPRWERKYNGVPSEILAIGDRLYFGGSDKYFYCADADDGGVSWQRPSVGIVRGRPAADADRVYFSGFDNVLRAVDRRDGEEKWQSGLKYRPWDGPVLIGSVVLVPGLSSTLTAFDARSGRAYKPVTFGERLLAPPAFVDTEKGPVVVALTGGLTAQWQLALFEQATTIAAVPLTVLPGVRRLLPSLPPVPSIPRLPLRVLPGVPVPLPGLAPTPPDKSDTASGTRRAP